MELICYLSLLRTRNFSGNICCQTGPVFWEHGPLLTGGVDGNGRCQTGHRTGISYRNSLVSIHAHLAWDLREQEVFHTTKHTKS